RYRERFAGERWRALQRRGALAQRPLWASTATKDPAYSDVLYVEQLIAANVITTMPEATLRAFADHGRVPRAPAIDLTAGGHTLQLAREAGIDLDAITAGLEREGVRAFCDSYVRVLACIDTKIDGPSTARQAGSSSR
ncbi:MAG TPA: transaldolase family protein, partial [Solirubrobacteraceae bacterium]|nr:transaldolase family protein [Solirubrobacteraceae bacterium]